MVHGTENAMSHDGALNAHMVHKTLSKILKGRLEVGDPGVDHGDRILCSAYDLRFKLISLMISTV